MIRKLLYFLLLLLIFISCNKATNEVQSEMPKENELIANFDQENCLVKDLFTKTEKRLLHFLMDYERIKEHPLGKVMIAYKSAKNQIWTNFDNMDKNTKKSFKQKENFVEMSYKIPAHPLYLTSTFLKTSDKEICWTLGVKNSGSEALEIGELGFSLPINNDYYTGFSQNDESMTELFNSRFYLQKFLGVDLAWVLFRRMTGDFPNLLFLAGEKTPLELTYNLKTKWEGIPYLFIASKATREKLQFKEDWINGHSSISLKPGESREFKFYFILLDEDRLRSGFHDMVKMLVDRAILNKGKLAITAFPGMVVPVDHPAFLMLHSKNRIASINSSKKTELSQLQNIRLPLIMLNFMEKGPNTITINLENGDKVNIHFLVVERIRDLLEKRANFICENQFYKNEGHILDKAFLVYDRFNRRMIVQPGTSWGSGGYEGGITEAMFLAEKNSIYPNLIQIQLLETYMDEFVFNKLQNPGSLEVGWVVGEDGTGHKIGRPYAFMHNIAFYYSMYKIDRNFNLLKRHKKDFYLRLAYETALCMFERGWKWHLNNVGFMNFSLLYEIYQSLIEEGWIKEGTKLYQLLEKRANHLFKIKFPYSAEPLYDTTGYEDVYFTSKFFGNYDLMEKTVNCAMAMKHYQPTWFWCGSDKRYWDAMENNPRDGYYGTDMGENCIHYTTTLTALVGLDFSEEPQYQPDDTIFYKSYAALLSELALIHQDGSASMCYTPDPISNHYGFNQFSGDVGLGLYGYLRGAKAYLVSLLKTFEMGFGCQVLSSDQNLLVIKMNDGVNQHFRYLDLDLSVDIDKGMLDIIKIAKNRRSMEIKLVNPSEFGFKSTIRIHGLWAKDFSISIDGKKYLDVSTTSGATKFQIDLAPSVVKEITISSK